MIISRPNWEEQVATCDELRLLNDPDGTARFVRENDTVYVKNGLSWMPSGNAAPPPIPVDAVTRLGDVVRE